MLSDQSCDATETSVMSTTTSATVTACDQKMKRKVTFGVVRVRIYSITIGDHPSCGRGVPITLDWDYQQLPPVSVDQFETIKKKFPRKKTLLLKAYKRQQRLLRLGYTGKQIQQAIQEKYKIQRQRRITRMLLPMYKWAESQRQNWFPRASM